MLAHHYMIHLSPLHHPPFHTSHHHLHPFTGITPLFLASRGSHLELVKALLKKGSDVNTQGATQNIGMYI